jgi:LruC domain-containing protein
MNKKVLLLFTGIAILAASCKKEITASDTVNDDPTSKEIPANFAWQTIKDVNFEIGITDSRFQNKIHVIEIYLEDPATGAEPVSKGSATLISALRTRLAIPTSLEEVYLVKTAPDGTKLTEKLSLNSANVSTELSAVSLSTSVTGTTAPTKVSEPICGIETSNPNISISDSTQIICFNSSADVKINVNANNGGTLKLNAPGKTITLGTFNHADLKLFISVGTTVVWSNDLNITRAETFVNNGTLSGFKINLGGLLINNKEISVSAFTVNSDAEFNNYCQLKVSGPFISNNLVNNYKLITAGSTIVNSNSVVNLFNGAMFQTDVFSAMNGTIKGIGSTSLFKTATTTSSPVYDNKSGRFEGSLQYCGDKQLNDNQNKVNHFFDGAIQSCDAFIAKDDCNTLGNSDKVVEIKPDTDKDGVIDICDDYPNDPKKAYNNYSCNYKNGGSTLAFEDNWPAEGDYDMNDVVLTYKHKAVTNAGNIIVRVEGEYNLIASGGDFSNGVGVMFNLPKEKATNFISSNNILPEDGQDSLVVVLFKDTRASQKNWNTVYGEATSARVKTTFSFDVLNGPNIQAIGIGGYNPFIWNNSSELGRKHETHLRGKNPTKLANTSLFNTKDDASAAGKNYSTAKNLPWALEIATSNFIYPTERSNIKGAYLKYSEWATSGGTKSVDWYKNTKDGYRDNSKLYGTK